MGNMKQENMGEYLYFPGVVRLLFKIIGLELEKSSIIFCCTFKKVQKLLNILNL